MLNTLHRELTDRFDAALEEAFADTGGYFDTGQLADVALAWMHERFGLERMEDGDG